MKVELSRFRVKKGKSQIVDEWLAFLNENMADTLLTLEDEKMYVESIHREFRDGKEYLYWYSVQGENGKTVFESESYIDKKHLEYWDECIDSDYSEEIIETKVILIADKVRASMK